jgi:hypothetical protein
MKNEKEETFANSTIIGGKANEVEINARNTCLLLLGIDGTTYLCINIGKKYIT